MSDAGKSVLFDKVTACLFRGAISDVLGTPAEWKLPPQIRERYGCITAFVEPWDGLPTWAKAMAGTPTTWRGE